MKLNWKFKPSSRTKWTFDNTSFSLELSEGWKQDKNAYHSLIFIKDIEPKGVIIIDLFTNDKDQLPDMDSVFKKNNIDPAIVKYDQINDWLVYEYDQTTKDGFFSRNYKLAKVNMLIYFTYVGEQNKKALRDIKKIAYSIQHEHYDKKWNVSPYDEDFAKSLVGKYIIVGYTHKKDDGTIVKYEQEHGVIIRVNAHEGIVIKPPKEKYTFSLPPDFRSLEQAKPGKYTLKSNGEVINNPDYLAYWVRDIEQEQAHKNHIYTLFKNKILAIRNYKSDKKHFIVDDFIDVKILGRILDEVDTGEGDITPAGKSFIKNYYGFGGLAKILVTQNVLTEAIKDLSYEGLISWLKSLEPMFTINFIETSRGNIKKGQKLREDLLPPKDLDETD